MKIIAISDTHNLHQLLNLPSGDVLVHSGDFTNHGKLEEMANFFHWFGKQNFPHKILIAGNHDFGLDPDFNPNRHLILNMLKENGITYLENSRVEINGVVFYGSPMVPKFCDFAWMRNRGEEINQYWKKIYNNVNVLITHCPPYGILDEEKEHLGCEMLAKRVKQLPKLQAHIFGHIHKGYGQVEIDGVKYNNAAIAGKNQPLVIEIGE